MLSESAKTSTYSTKKIQVIRLVLNLLSLIPDIFSFLSVCLCAARELNVGD